MAQIKGGNLVRKSPPPTGGQPGPSGTAGCLVQMDTYPDRVLLLTAGHVLLSGVTAKNDPIETPGAPGKVMGRLLSWTDLDGPVTVDAALVWADPLQVDPAILGLGVPKSVATGDGCVNPDPKEGDTLSIFDPKGVKPRTTTIAAGGLGASISLTIVTPEGSYEQPYANQIICRPAIARSGDSGAIVLDASNRVVGMVIGGTDPSNPGPDAYTAITPIAAILNHPSWRGGKLSILTQIPAGASAPTASLQAVAAMVSPAPAPAPLAAPARGKFGLDTNSPATAKNLATGAAGLGVQPEFWGRYFHAPGRLNWKGDKDNGLYDPGENAFLAERKIRLAPIAKQTVRVSKGAAEANDDAAKNVRAFFEAFSPGALAMAGSEYLFFLDSENNPAAESFPVSAEYYENWAKALVNIGDTQSGGRIKFLPGLYCSRDNIQAWSAVQQAVANGAPCAAMWVANWGSQNPAAVRDWNDSAVTPLHVEVQAPIVLWQYSNQTAYDASQFNPACVDAFLGKLPLPPLI